MKKKNKKVSVFDVVLTVIMVIFCAAIILPFVHIFAISVSSEILYRGHCGGVCKKRIRKEPD